MSATSERSAPNVGGRSVPPIGGVGISMIWWPSAANIRSLSNGKPCAAISSKTPTAWKALRALPWRVMPCPTPAHLSRSSTSTTWTPFWARARDSTLPVMPPPTTRTRWVWDSDMGSSLTGWFRVRVVGGSGGELRRARAGDPADDVVHLGVGDAAVGDLAAAVEDDDPVGHLLAQRQVVRDQHDRDALGGHPPDQRLDLLGLL